jgi:hypothetical protein
LDHDNIFHIHDKGPSIAGRELKEEEKMSERSAVQKEYCRWRWRRQPERRKRRSLKR